MVRYYVRRDVGQPPGRTNKAVEAGVQTSYVHSSMILTIYHCSDAVLYFKMLNHVGFFRPELLEGNYLLPCKIEEDTDMDDSSGRQSPVDPLPIIPTPTPAELVTLETGSCERQAGSLSARRRAESPDSQALDILKHSLESSIRRREMPSRDENMIWAESLGMRLQKMTPRQRAFVRAKVEQLMFDVEFAPAPDMPQNWEERFGCEGPTE